MRKGSILILLSLLCFLSVGCTSTVSVVLLPDLESANESIDIQLAEKGYSLTNKTSEQKNEVYVSGQSYSKYTGYGTKMDNNYYLYAGYTYTNSNDDKVSYTVKYQVKTDGFEPANFVFADNISVIGCESTASGKYNEICGDSGVVKGTIKEAKRTAVSVYDSLKTYCAAFVGAIGGSLILCLLLL